MASPTGYRPSSGGTSTGLPPRSAIWVATTTSTPLSVVVTRDSPTWQPATEDAEEIVTEALRDLARWLYRQLEVEYDHLTSDEAIEEGIIVNEYTFTEAGRRFG